MLIRVHSKKQNISRSNRNLRNITYHCGRVLVYLWGSICHGYYCNDMKYLRFCRSISNTVIDKISGFVTHLVPGLISFLVK